MSLRGNRKLFVTFSLHSCVFFCVFTSFFIFLSLVQWEGWRKIRLSLIIITNVFLFLATSSVEVYLIGWKIFCFVVICVIFFKLFVILAEFKLLYVGGDDDPVVGSYNIKTFPMQPSNGKLIIQWLETLFLRVFFFNFWRSALPFFVEL